MRWVFGIALLALLVGCSEPGPTVVVYTSVDQIYSEPILRDFVARSGIQVKPVFDVEATKTTGLVQRLIAEADYPRADVFWNSEFAQTMLLAERQLLQSYRPESAADLPLSMISPLRLWTAVGCRARVILVNSERVQPEDRPDSVDDLLTAERAGIADPLFGTTATHAAALAVERGHDQAVDFFERLRESGIHFADGNGAIRDLVVAGHLDWGLTDTDDACRAIERGAPVEMIFPDQDEEGTLLIPSTVAMMAGAPHPETAHALIEYLVSEETERRLIASGCVQLSVRPGGVRDPCLEKATITPLDIDLHSIYEALPPMQRDLAEIVHR